MTDSRRDRRSPRLDRPCPEVWAKIRRLRAEEGLTMQQLAQRFGISDSAVSRILKAHR